MSNIGIEQLTIYSLDGTARVTIIPGDNSTYEAELMKKEQLVLKFTLTDSVVFELGDYCECKWGRFELTEPYRPTINSAGGWQYELTMPAHYWKWANKILYYDRQHARECSFSLTHDISHHASLVLSNLATLGYKYNNQDYTVAIDSDVTTELKLISYSNSSITGALDSIADTFDCEWWVTDNIIHFGRCEVGTEVELAEGDEVTGMSASDSSQSYATRFLAFGSTKNLTQSYRPDSEEVVVGSIRDKRLMLPEGTPYIDTADGLPTEQAVEKVLVFDDIYPKRIGTIATVTTKTYTDEDTSTGTKTEWNAYRFTDDGINFSSDYKLKSSTDVLKVIFQTGSLAGMEFDINFNPDGYPEKDSSGAWDSRAQVYEIVRNETYGVQLPNDTLKPEVGNKYVLYNFDISYLGADLGSTSNYIELAEQELLDAAQKQVEKYKVDTKSYSCPINIVRYYGYEEDANGKLVHSTAAELDFVLGQKIKLINPAFFTDGRTSRIYGFEKYLNGTKVTYTVSDNIPMLMELTPSITYESITPASSSINLVGVNGDTSTQTLTFTKASFTNAVTGSYLYFSAKASNNSSMWLKVTEVEVTATYEEEVATSAWEHKEVYPRSMGGGNYRITVGTNAIRNLVVTLTATTLISTASSMEVTGTVTMEIGGYQGGDSMAIVPTSSESTLTETVIGQNGFASIWSSTFIFHLQANDRTYTDESGVEHSQPAGCTIMAGDYGWRITASGGIEQTADRGLNWG